MNRLQLTSGQRLPLLLLGVVALWALLFAVAGMAGLGGRYHPHPDDPGKVPEVPAVDLSRASSPLEAIELYAAIGEQPLFNPDRRPVPGDALGEGDDDGADEALAAPAVPLDVVVTSIILTPQLKLAIVMDNRSHQTQTVKLGEALEGEHAAWTLAELQPRKAVFTGPDGESMADLRVFDGSGAQAPSAPVAREPARERDSASADEDEAAPAQPGQAAEAASGGEALTPEQRSEMIRRRIEERRRQMRQEAARNN